MESPANKPAPRSRRLLIVCGAVGLLIGVAAVAATTEMVHWSSTTEFCGTACHNMTWAKEAYERGAHFKTASGVTAGCADCHIPYESTKANPLQYVALLSFKAKAGAVDAYHTMLGTIETKEKWEANRERLTSTAEKWMSGNKFMTCRGCHDVTKFKSGSEMSDVDHAGLLKEDNFDCLDCHEGVGHVYDKPAKKPAKAAAK
jgi:nitrate/TMAO reductase-like tetraheme cytochrome c subunit